MVGFNYLDTYEPVQPEPVAPPPPPEPEPLPHVEIAPDASVEQIVAGIIVNAANDAHASPNQVARALAMLFAAETGFTI